MKAPESSPPRLNHVALVTGGSRGIGAAICLELARSGAAVVVAARTLSDCQSVADEICGSGGQAWPVPLDVTDPASIASAVHEAQELSAELGGVGWLVNNAGIAESAPIDSITDPQIYNRHMDVNFHGARLMIETLLPMMKAHKYGRVVNIASSAGLRGYAYTAAYCASKFALVGHTLSAALELKRSGLTFNAVCPHYVDSPMLSTSIDRLVQLAGKTPEEARAFFANENPSGELVTPEHVASCVRGLLEGEESGSLVELDGSAQLISSYPNSPVAH